MARSARNASASYYKLKVKFHNHLLVLSKDVSGSVATTIFACLTCLLPYYYLWQFTLLGINDPSLTLGNLEIDACFQLIFITSLYYDIII